MVQHIKYNQNIKTLNIMRTYSIMHNIGFCFLQVIFVIIIKYSFIMEYSKSQKGNRVLLYRGYECLQARFQNGVTFWRCRYNRSHKCRLTLRTENDKVIQEPVNHSHDSCPQKARAKVLQEQMKDKMTALSATVVSSDVLAYLPKKTKFIC